MTVKTATQCVKMPSTTSMPDVGRPRFVAVSARLAPIALRSAVAAAHRGASCTWESWCSHTPEQGAELKASLTVSRRDSVIGAG